MIIQTNIFRLLCVFLTLLFMWMMLDMLNENGFLDDMSSDGRSKSWTSPQGQPLTLNKHEFLMKECIQPPSRMKHSLIGHEHVQKEVESIIHVCQTYAPSKSRKKHKIVEPPNAILLHGPPGTGKTSLAKQIANQAGCVFLHVSADQIENKYYGEGLKQLKAIFTLARKVKPCVIFFDEIDGVMSTRNSLDQSHTNTLKTTLLTLMDSIQSEWNILFIATTNRKDCLDPALLRRLDIQLQMGYPTREHQKQFFQRYFYIHDWDVENDFLPFLSMHTEYMSLSELKNFCKYCVRQYLFTKKPFFKERMQVSFSDFLTYFEDYTRLRN